MKIKFLLTLVPGLLIICSCKKETTYAVPGDINTVYWDFSKLKDTIKSNNFLLGEVGNNRNVDSLHVTVKDLDDNSTIFDGTVNKSSLQSETRPIYPGDVAKWYNINFTLPGNLTSGRNLEFTMVAHTPFDTGQDLRAQIKDVVFQ